MVVEIKDKVENKGIIKYKFCQCGLPNRETNNYCILCGKKISDIESKEATVLVIKSK